MVSAKGVVSADVAELASTLGVGGKQSAKAEPEGAAVISRVLAAKGAPAVAAQSKATKTTPAADGAAGASGQSRGRLDRDGRESQRRGRDSPRCVTGRRRHGRVFGETVRTVNAKSKASKSEEESFPDADATVDPGAGVAAAVAELSPTASGLAAGEMKLALASADAKSLSASADVAAASASLSAAKAPHEASTAKATEAETPAAVSPDAAAKTTTAAGPSTANPLRWWTRVTRRVLYNAWRRPPRRWAIAAVCG